MLHLILHEDTGCLKHMIGLIFLQQKCDFVDLQFSPKDKAACSNPGAGSVAASARKDKDPRQSSLKQRLSSVLCPDKMTLCRKRPNNAATLYRFLSECFSKMPPAIPSGEFSFCLVLGGCCDVR